MKRIIVFATIIFLLLVSAKTTQVYALKKRVRAARAIYSSAQLSRGTHSVIPTFYKLAGVAKFDYVLSYSANGIPQGVVGSFASTGSGSETRDLYFGTCSKGVCTPHYGITNAALTITATMTNGATYIKRYVLKNV
ncbi:MAG: hypothetical protein NTY06_04610 [Candidatus Gottesmanbacteria bacterium]|nr:hypothetical protein [Candidatus Gottesmanbacteria bacterium]